MSRKKLSDKTKLAAMILAWDRARSWGAGQQLDIPHEHAKQMTNDQIISLVHFDHYPRPHAEGGPDEAWNLEPRFIAEHRHKTATVDVPQIAKNKRVASKHQEWLDRMSKKEPGKSAHVRSRWFRR